MQGRIKRKQHSIEAFRLLFEAEKCTIKKGKE